jgi:RES domain-containing protein
LQRCLPLAARWDGDVFRFAAPRWSTAAELLTGDGAYLNGGRWCPLRMFRAVDTSLDLETSLAEALAQYRRFGWSVRDAMPKLVNGVEVHLHHVLDLTAGPVRRRLVLSWDRLIGERWWERQANDEEALTQAVGRAAWEAGLEGLLAPSAARAGGVNLVYFPERKLPHSSLTIIHPEELPAGVP